MADLDARLAVIEDRLDTLLELIHGGRRVRWEDSIRGRLHAVLQTQANEQSLAAAIREVRRSQRRRWSRWQRLVLLVAAVAAAAAPYVAIALRAG